MKIATINKGILIAFFLCAAGPGCALMGDFKKDQFKPANNSSGIPLKVPKGWDKREWTTDSAGHQTLTYHYGDGQVLYFSTNTGLSQWIDTAQHLPRPHLQGGIFYKGVLPRLQFWREVYSQGMRYGYRGVSRGAEPDFDSSLNFVRVR